MDLEVARFSRVYALILMDQSHEYEPRIHVVQNILKGMELGGQLGPQNR